MKNLFLLTTEKPSRLYHYKGEFGLAKGFQYGTDVIVNQNIYITDDSEIKEGYYIDLADNSILKASKEDLKSFKSYDKLQFKKIILTTDQDLIKDGVQSIDDEFLEWFVNNPSCERVEVERILQKRWGNVWEDLPNQEKGKEIDGIYRHIYKIIIPKEEVLLQSSIDGEPIWGEAPKQETLEEFAKKEADKFFKNK
jgi:hypothetical protein